MVLNESLSGNCEEYLGKFKLTSKWAYISTGTVSSAKREPKIKYHLARSKGQMQTHLECNGSFPSFERELGKRS